MFVWITLPSLWSELQLNINWWVVYIDKIEKILEIFREWGNNICFFQDQDKNNFVIKNANLNNWLVKLYSNVITNANDNETELDVQSKIIISEFISNIFISEDNYFKPIFKDKIDIIKQNNEDTIYLEKIQSMRNIAQLDPDLEESIRKAERILEINNEFQLLTNELLTLRNS